MSSTSKINSLLPAGTKVRVIQHVATDSQLGKTGVVRYAGIAAEVYIVAMDGQKDTFNPKKPKTMLWNAEDIEAV